MISPSPRDPDTQSAARVSHSGLTATRLTTTMSSFSIRTHRSDSIDLPPNREAASRTKSISPFNQSSPEKSVSGPFETTKGGGYGGVIIPRIMDAGALANKTRRLKDCNAGFTDASFRAADQRSPSTTANWFDCSGRPIFPKHGGTCDENKHSVNTCINKMSYRETSLDELNYENHRRIDEPIRLIDEQTGVMTRHGPSQELVLNWGDVLDRKCNEYFLRGYCRFGDRCTWNHDYLTENQVKALRVRARRTRCRNGDACADRQCFSGHTFGLTNRTRDYQLPEAVPKTISHRSKSSMAPVMKSWRDHQKSYSLWKSMQTSDQVCGHQRH